ncbi:MAG: thiamine ABC transporter substrate-binding protein [Actinobacteria bacterium]|nr:thiamine ABC transporter substrate-binding protein [Actinomycetota bacterium]
MIARRSLRRDAAIITLFALVGAACQGSDRQPQGAEPVTITLLTHDSFDVSESVLRAFERDSGIRIRLLPAGDAGQLVNRAILSAGNPEGDVLFGIDNNLLATALEREVFLPYASPRLDAVDDRFELDPEHRVTPIDHGEVCLNFERAYFAWPRTSRPPQTLEELTDPAYRDLLVVENPATSTPGLAFLLATIAAYGDPGWEDYWKRLRANGVLVVEGWEAAYFGEFSGAGGGEGTRPLVVSYATSPVAEVVFAEQPPDTAPTGVVEASCFRQIEFAGILRGTGHEREARAVIDFLLSKGFQEDVPLRMFVYPVVDDATLPDVFAEHAVVPEAPLELSAEVIAVGREEWVERWTDIVLR